MTSLETLKNELELQKSAIESKNGVVNVARNHVSPSEITAGINSILMPDMSLADATADNVEVGKTFYAQDYTLKTGTRVMYSNEMINLLYYNHGTMPNGVTYNVTTPTGITTLKPYVFCDCLARVNLTFNPEIVTLGARSMYKAINFNIQNFSSLQNITNIEDYAMYQVNGIDWAYLPETIKKIGIYALYQTGANSTDLKLPPILNQLSAYNFISGTERTLNSFTFGQFNFTTFESHQFYQTHFNCDMVMPEGITKIGDYAFYRGGFNNITLPSTLTIMQSCAFGQYNSDPVTNSNLQSITFLNPSPPALGYDSIGSIFLNRVSNPLLIYVPDEAVDRYKTATGFTSFANNIRPISQRP